LEKLAAVLIAVHAIADFSLQTDGLAKQKEKLRFLFLHAGIHAALIYLALQAWTVWQAPVFVFIAHALIDFVKQRWNKDTATAYAVDQAAHVLSLLALALLLSQLGWLSGFSGAGFKPLIAVAGFIATVQGSGFFIGKFARRLMEENQLELDGLLDGGKWIGQLERSLIYLFIFIGQPAGIGFLVAAKSILRFEEAKQQKLAEYVLIGTLLSFSLAIALAWVTKWAMGM
jgi:hypothetical protein